MAAFAADSPGPRSSISVSGTVSFLPAVAARTDSRWSRDDSGRGEQTLEVIVAGWARRQPSARENLSKMDQMIPGYLQRGIIRVRPTRFLGWPQGDLQRAPEIVEVN